MKPSLLRLSRLFAWTSVLGALVVLTLGYGSLPDQIPVTRWTSESKTLALVLRVPLINLICQALIHTLESALVRAHGGTSLRENAMRVCALLYATVGLKSFLEAMELLLLPAVTSWILPVLLLTVLAGLTGAVRAGLPLARKSAHPKVEFTGSEKAFAALCVLGILCLQFLPVWR